MKADNFSPELTAQIGRAERQGRPHVEVNSGELHRIIGGYPDASAHRMPECCRVMRDAMQTGDVVVFEPPSGQGASLTIRYVFPRQR